VFDVGNGVLFFQPGVIDKLVANNIAIDVHQPEKPNPLLRTLGDVALPLLTIAGVAGVVDGIAGSILREFQWGNLSEVSSFVSKKT